MTGRKFGNLEVLGEGPEYVSPKGYRKLMWRCRCTCGNICNVMGSHLLSGHSSSCGCQQTAKLKPREAGDLVGQRFGMLTVVNRMPNRQVGKNSCVVWHCRCDCGNETDVLALLLSEGLVKSCGCLSISHAERIMKDYLAERNIKFEAEYHPDGLCGIGGGQLRFDFALFLDSRLAFLVELDGAQHRMPVKYFGGTSKYEQVKAHDGLKESWAVQNDVTLIRIDVSTCRLDSDFVDTYDKVFSSYHVLD